MRIKCAIRAMITRKLHKAVTEIEPSQADWFDAIMFRAQTGQACTDWRHEYILLSDVPGVSMLVDAINNRKPSGASESPVLGPFHVPDAPDLLMGGHSRTGLEDNLWLNSDGLATPNAALVRRVVDLCGKYHRPVATAAQDHRTSAATAGFACTMTQR